MIAAAVAPVRPERAHPWYEMRAPPAGDSCRALHANDPFGRLRLQPRCEVGTDAPESACPLGQRAILRQIHAGFCGMPPASPKLHNTVTV